MCQTMISPRSSPLGVSILELLRAHLDVLEHLQEYGSLPQGSHSTRTSPALALASNIAHSTSVTLIAVVLARHEILNGLLAIEAGVDLRRFTGGHLYPDEWAKISNAIEPLSKLPIRVASVEGHGVHEWQRLTDEVARSSTVLVVDAPRSRRLVESLPKDP
jgi:replicative DNA helicase